MRQQGKLNLPNEETDRLMYKATAEVLCDYGYCQYEISNYSQPNRECKHNLKYWTRTPALGFGLGSHSFFAETSQDKLAPEVRWHNTYDLNTYIANPTQRLDIMRLTQTEAMEEFIFLGLRLNEGISPKDFQKCGKELMEVYGDIINKNISDGLLCFSDNRLCLTAFGRDVSNYVFAQFLR
jgi:oxygen-independent coproporphyrinogen-3 oxidase